VEGGGAGWHNSKIASPRFCAEIARCSRTYSITDNGTMQETALRAASRRRDGDDRGRRRELGHCRDQRRGRNISPDDPPEPNVDDRGRRHAWRAGHRVIRGCSRSATRPRSRIAEPTRSCHGRRSGTSRRGIPAIAPRHQARRGRPVAHGDRDFAARRGCFP